MSAVLGVIVLCCFAIAVLDWRKGLYACVVAGLVQDPLRKILPEEPIYLTLVAAVVFALAAVNAFARGVSFRPGQFAGWSRGLSAPFAFLVIWILIQSLLSLIAYQSPLVTAVGLATYAAPIPALVLGHQFALRAGPDGIQAWLRFYLVFVLIALSTVVMEYAGIQSDLFGQVGEGMKIYDLGTVLIGKTGTFRSTEVAAWHATAAACFAFVVLTSDKIDNKQIMIAATIALVMIAVAVLTGRRKSIMAVAIFATAYLFLFSVIYKDVAHWLLGLMAVGATLFLIWGSLLDSEVESRSEAIAEYQLFLDRGTTVFEEAPDRFLAMSVGQAEWATRATGLFGAGVGAVTSGARHVGNVGRQFGGIGEGGVGKVIGELGIPGLLFMAWFMLALLRHIWRVLTYTARQSPPVFRLAAGLVAFLVANVTTFVVNTQIFSDFFILIVIGLTLGFLLATPVLVQRPVKAAHERASPAPVRVTAQP